MTTANQTIDDILGLADDVQHVSTQVSEKVQNFKLKNEMVNGDFSNGLLDWRVAGASASVSEGRLRINTKTPNSGYVQTSTLLKLGSKYYYKYDSRVQSGSVSDGAYIGGIQIPITVSGSMVNRSGVVTADSTIALFGVFNTNVVTDRYYDNILIIDLTATFGAGNEPTKEEMDRLVEMVPNQWWDGELDLTQQQYVNWLFSFIREKANKKPEAWITPTLLNGVTNYAAGISPVRYYKNEFNTVFLDGISSTVASGTIIFILPVGYRPSKRLYVPTAVGNVFGWLEIDTDGSVKPGLNSPSNVYVSYSGISFRAER